MHLFHDTHTVVSDLKNLGIANIKDDSITFHSPMLVLNAISASSKQTEMKNDIFAYPKINCGIFVPKVQASGSRIKVGGHLFGTITAFDPKLKPIGAKRIGGKWKLTADKESQVEVSKDECWQDLMDLLNGSCTNDVLIATLQVLSYDGDIAIITDNVDSNYLPDVRYLVFSTREGFRPIGFMFPIGHLGNVYGVWKYSSKYMDQPHLASPIERFKLALKLTC